MKLLIVTDHYRDEHENGSEVFASALIDALAREHEVDVLARRAPNGATGRRVARWLIDDDVVADDDALPSFLSHAIDTRRYDLVYNLGALLFGCRVVEILRDHQPDLPVVNHFQALLGPYAAAEGRPDHEVAAHGALQVAAAAGARMNIFLSQGEFRAALEQGMALDGEAAVIPNGVAPLRTRPVADRSFVPAGNPIVIATSGRFADAVKGADLVYRAFAQLAAERDDVFLLSIGNSERFAAALHAVPRERWTIVPWQTRKRFFTLLAAADLVVLPSRYEPFGLIALEALSLGVPVLANCVGGLAEIVHHGRFGMLNRLEDGSFGLYLGMRALVSDRERLRTMGRAGREFVRKEYSAARVVSLVNAALQRAVLARPPVYATQRVAV